jgi:hypothetical protein
MIGCEHIWVIVSSLIPRLPAPKRLEDLVSSKVQHNGTREATHGVIHFPSSDQDCLCYISSLFSPPLSFCSLSAKLHFELTTQNSKLPHRTPFATHTTKKTNYTPTNYALPTQNASQHVTTPRHGPRRYSNSHDPPNPHPILLRPQTSQHRTLATTLPLRPECRARRVHHWGFGEEVFCAYIDFDFNSNDG